MTDRFPNSHLWRPPARVPCFSPLPSTRLSLRTLRQTMLLDTTGSRKKAGNSEKSMASTGEPLIFGSASPTLMPHPCASKGEEPTWATTRITSWMEANVG